MEELIVTKNMDGLVALFSDAFKSSDESKKKESVAEFRVAVEKIKPSSDVVVELETAIYGIPEIHLIPFQDIYYEVLFLFGRMFEAAGDTVQAERRYARYVGAPTNVSPLPLTDRLLASSGLLRCALKNKSWRNAVFAVNKTAEWRRNQLPSLDALPEDTKAALILYLRELANCNAIQKKFLVASQVYYDLYQLEAEQPSGKEHFKKALLCAVLSEVGVKRTSYLVRLQVEKEHFVALSDLWNVLDKVLSHKSVAPGEVALLTERYATDVIAGGEIKSAILEHNIFVASLYYTSIKIDHLSKRVNLPDKAELIQKLVNMSMSKRLALKIDEEEQCVYFLANKGFQTMAEWDSKIERICNTITHVTESIRKSHPELMTRSDS